MLRSTRMGLAHLRPFYFNSVYLTTGDIPCGNIFCLILHLGFPLFLFQAITIHVFVGVRYAMCYGYLTYNAVDAVHWSGFLI